MERDRRVMSPHLFEKNTVIFKPDMCAYETRVSTFVNWPHGSPKSPEDMARCGFYFVGIKDKVSCYYCGLSLHCWLSTDDPWLEHALYSCRCIYLRSNKHKMNQDVKKGNVISNWFMVTLCILCISVFIFFII